MNALEKLMQFDEGKLKLPTGEVKIRLKKLGGEEFVFSIQALPPDVAGEIAQQMIDIRFAKNGNKSASFEIYRAQIRTIIEGCPTIFKNADLQKKFGARTPSELVEKLMLSGEMDELSKAIEGLSGYEDERDNLKN